MIISDIFGEPDYDYLERFFDISTVRLHADFRLRFKFEFWKQFLINSHIFSTSVQNGGETGHVAHAISARVFSES